MVRRTHGMPIRNMRATSRSCAVPVLITAAVQELSSDRMKAGRHPHVPSQQYKTAGPTPCRLVENRCGYFLLTAFFSSAPGVNFATFRAAILMVAPVCGLRPLRAFLEETAKVPNPIRATRSPFLSAAVMLSTAVSIAVPAAALLMPAPAEILSMRSPLFIVSPGRFEDPQRPVGEPYSARWSGNLAAAIFLP